MKLEINREITCYQCGNLIKENQTAVYSMDSYYKTLTDFPFLHKTCPTMAKSKKSRPCQYCGVGNYAGSGVCWSCNKFFTEKCRFCGQEDYNWLIYCHEPKCEKNPRLIKHSQSAKPGIRMRARKRISSILGV